MLPPWLDRTAASMKATPATPASMAVFRRNGGADAGEQGGGVAVELRETFEIAFGVAGGDASGGLGVFGKARHASV